MSTALLDPARSAKAAPGAAPLLTLDGIVISFGGVTALSGISLAVAEGEVCAIIGPNGAGKSSLLNIVNGVYQPDKGTISFAGSLVPRLDPNRAAGLGIARTFQNIALFSHMTVLDNLIMGHVREVRSGMLEQLFGLKRARVDEAEGRARAEEMLSFLGLQAMRDRIVKTLPYGVQKRVELGRALVAQPRLLLLDEPMAGMNAGEKAEMCGFVLDAKDEFDTTVVLIEHDIGVVMDLSDHVVVLDHGLKIADGTPAEVRADQAVIDAYLGREHAE